MSKTAHTPTPDEAFCRDVPEHKRDEIMVMISEAAHDPSCHTDCITILEQDRIDAINVRAHGIIEIDGDEYTFHIEDGNRRGTVLEAWNGDKEFEPKPRTMWALQPRHDLISDAIIKGEGPFLLVKWDALLKRPEVASIPSNYSYDRMVQPGLKIEQHYKAAAEKFGFVLVDDEHAQETRKRLAEASENTEEA